MPPITSIEIALRCNDVVADAGTGGAPGMFASVSDGSRNGLIASHPRVRPSCGRYKNAMLPVAADTVSPSGALTRSACCPIERRPERWRRSGDLRALYRRLTRGIGCDEEKRVAGIDVVRSAGDPGRRITRIKLGKMGLGRKRVQLNDGNGIRRVSKICGVWLGPGDALHPMPAGMSTLSGDPAALESVNASTAEAATPGEGT